MYGTYPGLEVCLGYYGTLSFYCWRSTVPVKCITVMKFKATKINSGGFSDFVQKLAPLKLTRHMVPRANAVCVILCVPSCSLCYSTCIML